LTLVVSDPDHSPSAATTVCPAAAAGRPRGQHDRTDRQLWLDGVRGR